MIIEVCLSDANMCNIPSYDDDDDNSHNKLKLYNPVYIYIYLSMCAHVCFHAAASKSCS